MPEKEEKTHPHLAGGGRRRKEKEEKEEATLIKYDKIISNLETLTWQVGNNQVGIVMI